MKIPLKNIMSSMHKLIKDYNLIQDGDHIAVGVSGGKDSLTLLATLAQYGLHSKNKFKISAIAVDIFGNTDYTKIEDFCKSLGVDFFVEKTSIKAIVFDTRHEQNPCSLCANLRRGVLNSKAQKLGCNKVALGHHADDMLETFFMSISKENRLNTIKPISYLSKTNLFVIRPLLYVFEKQILAITKYLPIIENNCPANKHTNRETAKKIVEDLDKKIPNFKKNLHSALINPSRNSLWPLT